MLASTIKSKPVYCALAPDFQGTSHLLIGQGGGGDAICRLYGELAANGATVSIHYTGESVAGTDRSQQVAALGSEDSHLYTDSAALCAEIGQVIKAAPMGIRVYIAGTERFIWNVTNAAFAAGLKADAIQQEQADSLARSVVCVHCNAESYPVTTNIVACHSCGRPLLVRDHFSRRLNAYMGVQVNAEVPSEIPERMEVFLP